MSPDPRQVKASSRGGKASSDKVGIDLGAIKQAKLRDYGVRFAFGAAVSVAAGLAGLKFGPKVGGLFLAFPAILPAALTLIEKKDGAGPADADVQGGVLGAIGLLLFALVVYAGVEVLGAPIALGVALAAWALTGSGLYLLLRHYWPSVWR